MAFVSILLLMIALVRATGATFTESFSSEPREWEIWNPGRFVGMLKIRIWR